MNRDRAHKPMSDQLRISRAWARRFAEQKIAVPILLRRAGLPPGLFQQEKVYVTTAELFALWRSVGEMAPDPAIGLRLGAETRFERSHPAAIAVMCSRTFADALERLGRYKKLTCPEEIRVRKKSGEAAVEFVYVEAVEAQPDPLVDMVLSWILAVGQRGTDGQIAPLRLELARPPKHREALEGHFGCQALFNADRNALVFRCSDLDRPFVTHNEELLTVIGTQFDAELEARGESQNVGERVKDALQRSLAGKRPALQDVARELGLGARTLQRRLTDAGFTFQQLVEETRRELARYYLRQSAVELNETAFLLGFEDANSFFRAFHGWEGTSPGEWRTRYCPAIEPQVCNS
jgi:AraC-like DNA-binding protein